MKNTHPTSHSHHTAVATTETAVVDVSQAPHAATVAKTAPSAEVTSTPATPSSPPSGGAEGGSATSAGSGSPPTTGRFVAPPPAPDPDFVPPPGFVADNAMDFRGVLPRTAELVVLTAAVEDLKKFTDYTQVMGSKAPAWSQVIVAFDVTSQWSSARTQADAWDGYARTQEGVSWTMLRALMAQMAPIYQAAVASDPTMASQLPALTTLLGAKKTIAAKAVSTKKANAKERAAGKTPTHGQVGKRQTKAAQKEALAEKLAAAQSANAGAGGGNAPAPAPAGLAAGGGASAGNAPGGSGVNAEGASGGNAQVAPAPEVLPLANGASGANGAPGATNGAGHS